MDLGELSVAGIPVLTPRRLVATLRALPPHIGEVGAMLLAEPAPPPAPPAT